MTTDARRPLKVGVIGLGFGRTHIQGYQATEGVEVIAVCQRRKDRAEAVANEFGIPNVFTDYRELINLDEIDAVSIASPPYLHLPMVSEAVKAKKHVLCEKPLAINAQEGYQMLKALQEAGLIHMTAFNWRHIPAFTRMKELIDEGYVGEIFHVQARWLSDGRANPERPRTWRANRDEAGVGAMGDTGVHLIDMIRWIAGDVRRISALTSTYMKEIRQPRSGEVYTSNVDDSCSFVAETVGGAQVVSQVSSVAPGRNSIQVEVSGKKGTLFYEIDRSRPDWMIGILKGTQELGKGLQELPIPERLLEGLDRSQLATAAGRFVFAKITREFARGIRGNIPVEPSLYQGVKAQEVLDAIEQSNREGRWVEL
ncbi:MAG: Gfo/Idh/MocA family oxidoreductase [Candidatus Tectomicrobia bacterium]|nr:Gfo/Idh/MocA family oxidoreductase [Candidatus Tectomicrobia bacterium]